MSEATTPKAVLRRWDVTVGGYGLSSVTAITRGQALADTWRSDAFNHLDFGQFLKIARARRGSEPEWWGLAIVVLGKPAYYYGHDRQYVHFAYPGRKFTNVAHPYDVEPERFRPEAYRSAQGMETRQGENPQGFRAKHDSPVPAGDAPKDPRHD